MLTTLVMTVTVATGGLSVVVLASMDVEAASFWDPRTQLQLARSLVQSAARRSQLLVTGCWGVVSGLHNSKARAEPCSLGERS